mmetsp:Transcript_28680/g.29011  ORF Transcript_28680/g.29011 Transcript_28680/m.29011 type:complete len:475 (-) Transcript_28680:54-1478(-)
MTCNRFSLIENKVQKNYSPQNYTFLGSLGDEIVIDILSFVVPFYDLINATAVCHQLRNLIFSVDATILWTTEPMILCIEANPKNNRYYFNYPNNTVHKPLAYNLLSKCRLKQVEIHCFMDDLSLSLSALGISKSIQYLHLFLDRSLSGRLPLELISVSHLNHHNFPNLTTLIIQPAIDAKSIPIHPLSSLGGYQLFQNFKNLQQLKILSYTPPIDIFQILQTYCPHLIQLEVPSWLGLNISKALCKFNLKLQILHIYGYSIHIDSLLQLPYLNQFQCSMHFLDDDDVTRKISCIPSSLIYLRLEIPSGYSNPTYHIISKLFPNLQSLNIHVSSAVAMITGYSVDRITIDTLRVLSLGCPLLHTLYLPITSDFEPGAVSVFAEFPHLTQLFLWVHHDNALREIEIVLRESKSVKEVIFFGFGPEDADWSDLGSNEHLLRMVEWHDLKRTIRDIAVYFPHVYMDALVYDDLHENVI